MDFWGFLVYYYFNISLNNNKMIHKKKTKIVCTLGPATSSKEKLEELIVAGMNVARLNFSHDTKEEHRRRIAMIRKSSEEIGIPVAILQDLCGPKIRIGTFKNDSIVLKEGAEFILSTEDVEGDENIVSVNYADLHKEVKVGESILVHDGKKKLEVVEIKGKKIVCRVIVGGELKGKRGVNLPNTDLSIPCLTEKDREDLKVGMEECVDFIALSFVRRPEDIKELRDILKNNNSKAGIIAKIETPQAVKHIDKILELADGVMVARGDLAIEIPAEDVPLVQKIIIRKANRLGKPVIVATQMLESMIKSPVPTRAEVSDIANAILDGTDAIMLSEETTLGDYPVQSVDVMTRVALRTENDFQHREKFCKSEKFGDVSKGIGDSITDEIVDLADSIDAKFIIALTFSGNTPRLISRYKSSKIIFALTPNEDVYYKMMLSYGCVSVLIPEFKNLDEALDMIRDYCILKGLAKIGDKVVVAAGMPFGKDIETNMILVETI